MKILPTEFEGQSIRRVFDEDTETWWFSVVDVVQVLTDSKSAKRYWSDLKRKLAQEAGSEQPYEEIVQLKLTATDGKQRETDCARAATLLRIVQSVPSPKAEPIKLWLAKVVMQSVNRIMVAHIHRNDLLVLNQQLQRDAVRQVDGHRMQALKLTSQGMQPQRGVRGVCLQQLKRLEVRTAQRRMLLQKLGGPAVVLFGKD